MAKVKVLDIMWANNSLGSVGMILADNGFGTKHVYVGSVEGSDEKEDIQKILEWGTKFKADSLKSFLKS